MFEEHYDFRRRLVEALERDLMGPSSPDEVIGDPPITRYVAGVPVPARCRHRRRHCRHGARQLRLG